MRIAPLVTNPMQVVSPIASAAAQPSRRTRAVSPRRSWPAERGLLPGDRRPDRLLVWFHAIALCMAVCPAFAQGIAANGAFDRLVTSDRVEAPRARDKRAAVGDQRRKVFPYAVASAGDSKTATTLTGVVGVQFVCDHPLGCAEKENPRADASFAFTSLNLDAGPTLDVWSAGASYRIVPTPAGWSVTPFVQYADVSRAEEEVDLGVAFDHGAGPIKFTLNVALVRATPDIGSDREDVRFATGASWQTPFGFSVALEHEIEDDVNGRSSTIASLKSGAVKFSVSDTHTVKGSLILPF